MALTVNKTALLLVFFIISLIVIVISNEFILNFLITK